MQLEGKKAVFLGDSITAGGGATAQEYIYWEVFGRQFGLSSIKGYGIGGTRIARKAVPSAESYYDQDLCSRYTQMDEDADIVVVFGGTNDFGHGDAPIGTPADRTPDTFYGACHYLMRGLIERYPMSTVVFMTPLHRSCETREGMPPLCRYVDVIKEVAREYSLPVLDLYANFGIQPQIEAHRVAFMPDGLHPSNDGAARIADRLGHFLLSL